MGLDVTVETTEAGLTTVASLKTELGIATTSEDDRLLRLVKTASAWA